MSLNMYYIFEGADPQKPGSGFVKEMFETTDDKSAMELARRHFEGTGFTVWAKNEINRLGHIMFRFVGPIDKEKPYGSGTPAG